MEKYKLKVNEIKTLDGNSIIMTTLVRVNDKYMGLMVIDTGATHTTFDKENIAKWCLVHNSLIDPSIIIDLPGDNQIEGQQHKLDNFQVGDCIMKDFPVIIANIFNEENLLTAGILGMDFFSRFETVIFKVGEVILEGLKK